MLAGGSKVGRWTHGTGARDPERLHGDYYYGAVSSMTSANRRRPLSEGAWRSGFRGVECCSHGGDGDGDGDERAGKGVVA